MPGRITFLEKFLMMISYLNTALRNLIRYRTYSLVNIFGMAISLAICLLVIGHICYELSFEDCHANREHIYRVNGRFQYEDQDIYSAQVMPPLGMAVRENIPGVLAAARFRLMGKVDLDAGAKSYQNKTEYSREGYKFGGNVLCANQDFLKVFTIPIKQGNAESALVEPYSVLISESTAQTLFPNSDPVNDILQINDELTCRITGIMADIPQNTQIHCDIIVSYPTLEQTGVDMYSWIDLHGDYLYLLLGEHIDPEPLAAGILEVAGKYISEDQLPRYHFELQPLDEIYFSVYGSNRSGELFPAGEASLIITLIIVAMFILALTIANFINLSTAQGAERWKEIGVRKVLGAGRHHLVQQFLGETLIITIVSVALGVFLYEIFKLFIDPVLPREMLADYYNSYRMVLGLILLTIGVGVLAGAYPALYLSRFRPIMVLQNQSLASGGRSWLRRGLVIFQFTIAIIFMCSTLLIHRQISYIQEMELGFDRDNMLVLDFKGDEAAHICARMKTAIQKIPAVASVTAVNAPPGRRSNTSYGYYTDPERENMVVARSYFTDPDFLATFQLKLKEGRNFSLDRAADEMQALLINESGARELQLSNPIGHKLYGSEDRVYEIVGVVEDFLGTSLDWRYKPLSTIWLSPERVKALSIKLTPGNTTAAINEIQSIWQEILPDIPFTYNFLDEEIRTNYRSDEGPMLMMFVLAILTITIACLGIYALVSFSTSRRTREIGIRKILGASVGRIIAMLTREFMVLVIIANVLAWPLSYLMILGFLREWAFRAPIQVSTFMLTGMIGLVLALSSAGVQALRPANNNPVEALRQE